MKHLKVFIVTCLMMGGVWSANALDDDVFKDLETAEETDEAPKINWDPVWGDLEGPDTLHHSYHHIEGHDGHSGEDHSENATEGQEEVNLASPEATETDISIPYTTAQADLCTIDGKVGLKNLIDEVEQILMPNQVTSALALFASREEIQDLLRLVRSTEFLAKVSNILKSEEYLALKDYACIYLHLDLDFYENHLQSLFSSSKDIVPLPEYEGFESSYASALKSSIKQRYIHLLLKDEVLNKQLEYLKSREFDNLVELLRQNPDFHNIEQLLKEIGFSFDRLVQFVKHFTNLSDNIHQMSN